jgi:hypothetical protein
MNRDKNAATLALGSPMLYTDDLSSRGRDLAVVLNWAIDDCDLRGIHAHLWEREPSVVGKVSPLDRLQTLTPLGRESCVESHDSRLKLVSRDRTRNGSPNRRMGEMAPPFAMTFGDPGVQRFGNAILLILCLSFLCESRNRADSLPRARCCRFARSVGGDSAWGAIDSSPRMRQTMQREGPADKRSDDNKANCSGTARASTS